MGGGGSTHHVHYDNSAQQRVQQQIAEQKRVAAENLRKEQELQAEQRRLQAEQQAVQQRLAEALERERRKTPAQLFDDLLQTLRTSRADYCSKRSTSPTIVKVGVIGKAKVGKSTSLNARFELLGDKRQKTGVGTTTRIVSCVGTLTSAALPLLGGVQMQVHDFPGDESGFNYQADENLRQIGAMDIVIVLFNDSPDYCLPILRIAEALGVCALVARNWVDNFDPDDAVPVAQQIVQDCRDIQARIPSFAGPVFAISSRNACNRTRELQKLKDDASYAPVAYDTFQWDDLWRAASETAAAIGARR